MSKTIKGLLVAVAVVAAFAGGAYFGRASKSNVVITSTTGGAQYSGGFRAEGQGAEQVKAATAHGRITAAVEAAIRTGHPKADIVVHVEPAALLAFP